LDFATRQLSLKNLKNDENLAKKFFFEEALFQCTFCPFLIFGLQKLLFDLKCAIEMSVITKWGPGGKI
jgi:hypothetical protein